MHVVTVFVCTACQTPGDDAGKIGAALLERLRERLPRGTSVRIEPVDCLAVCDRPSTIAFAAPGQWTYLIGDIDPEADVDDILLAALRLARNDQPVLPIAERPPFFRKGVIGRVPPMP